SDHVELVRLRASQRVRRLRVQLSGNNQNSAHLGEKLLGENSSGPLCQPTSQPRLLRLGNGRHGLRIRSERRRLPYSGLHPGRKINCDCFGSGIIEASSREPLSEPRGFRGAVEQGVPLLAPFQQGRAASFPFPPPLALPLSSRRREG